MEIGPGGGKITSHLVGNGRTVYVSDVSPKMLQMTCDRLPEVKPHLITDFKWPYLEGFFDLVVSHDCLVHVEAADIFFYIGEIRRVLKTGGIAILHVTNTNTSVGFSNWVSQMKGHKLGQRAFYSFGVMNELLIRQMATHYGLNTIECTSLVSGRDIMVVMERLR